MSAINQYKLIGFPISLVLSFLFCFSSIAQQPNKRGELSGIILENITNSPLQFASIGIYTSSDSLISGGLSDEEGKLLIDIPNGQYYALVEFMGYKPFKTDLFIISKDIPSHDLGQIMLLTTAGDLDEVVVQGDKTIMELSLDKRVFNVGKDLANAGGTASDILMNLPSISVDPEGNVQLRGSANVRILIDGKPSGLVSFKGSSGLRQLPANMVERVEVITNPSARYEAEGMSGVINIILKKENQEGFNGSFEVIVGTPTNLGFTANLNYRHKKINWFINYGLSHRRSPNVGELYQEVYGQDTTFILNQSSEGNVSSINNNIRGGLDYYFNENSILTASYLWRRSDAHRITDIRYEDSWNTSKNLQTYTLRRQDETEEEPNSEISANYKRAFERKGHELTTTFTYLNYWENSDQLFTQSTFSPQGVEDIPLEQTQTSLNDEYENQYLLMLDYVKPFGKEGKFETGFRTSFRRMKNDYIVQEKGEDDNFSPIPGLDNIFIYNENIMAAYSIIGNKKNNWSYQAGLRVENTDVETILEETNEVNPRKYTNLFPSAHLTYNVSLENAFQLSYSRRVQRPVYNDLSPYVTFSDSRNFFSGNPDLNPEFTNAFELGHIKYFDKGTLFTTVYYRSTVDKIERLRTVNDDGFSVTKPYNLNGENSFGVELSGDFRANEWWKVDMNVNFFHANIDGSNIQAGYTAKTYSWLFRQTSRFTLNNGLDLQLRINYEAKQKTAQGVRKGVFYMDLSASKDILSDRGTLILNVIDILNSRINRYITEGVNFYTEGSSQRQMRQINLTMNYRLKQ
ncbi:outer membrane receptor protein involved in Fe transport [Algoriphagus ratkowskyi]|uniref:Outer membrane receptor protein involved in Fe transport n=1 Tax=Algoriphagus ratkowskyi TaxID=57028 RepID=A0A2W7TAC7_9BACT|nr:outer membrane beta-barrel family protein [Algoriphagus ratkowskyi]PZX60122.1 outer membrane receptor protein involved in Fe transport [Algoriphagus ratkowskyi]TXD75667.1 TonB-dependent receptor [Algoriphagus ratkowskyi]